MSSPQAAANGEITQVNNWIVYNKPTLNCNKTKLQRHRATTSWYFRGGGQNDCKLMLYLTTKRVFENFGGGNCPLASLWLRHCSGIRK